MKKRDHITEEKIVVVSTTIQQGPPTSGLVEFLDTCGALSRFASGWIKCSAET